MTSVVPPPPTALQSTGMPQAPLVSQTPVRRADAPSRGRGLRAAALAALCLAELLVVIDNTIVNVAIPTFARDLNASTTGLQWIVDAYTLAFACLLLPAGHLGDRIGRRVRCGEWCNGAVHHLGCGDNVPCAAWRMRCTRLSRHALTHHDYL